MQQVSKRRAIGAWPALAAVLVALVVAGCGSDDEGGAASDGSSAPDDPIVLGAAVAQSGGFELYDNEVLKGIRHKMDEINASGGIDGRKLELVVADHKTDVARVAAATEEVLSKGADVVVTTADYDFAAPAALVGNKAGKLVLGGAGAPEYGKKGLGPLTFNVYQGTPTETAVMAEMAKAKGWTRPFLLQDTSIEYSKSVCELFKEAWTAQGGQIAGERTFKNDDPSISSQVNAVNSSDADFVVACSYPPGGASAIRQLRTGGVNLPILGDVAYDGTFWLKSTPNLSDFYYPAMVSSAADDPNEEVNAFLEAVDPAGGALYALFGYEVVETVEYAVKAARSTDGAALAKAIETFKDEPFLVGPTTYTAECHIPLGRPMVSMEIQDGQPRFVDSIEPEDLPESPC